MRGSRPKKKVVRPDAELEMLRRKAIARVADIPLRAKAAASVRYLDRWLDDIEMLSAALFRNDPLRAGALCLTEAEAMIRETRLAVVAGDAHRAAWAGMRAIHAVWMAQTLDAEKIVKASVRRDRSAKVENDVRQRSAGIRYAQWRQQADEIRKKNPRLSNTSVAKKIDRLRWNTIRRHI